MTKTKPSNLNMKKETEDFLNIVRTLHKEKEIVLKEEFPIFKTH